jgi:ATP-dependent Clp protease adaptor protein ClpS
MSPSPAVAAPRTTTVEVADERLAPARPWIVIVWDDPINLMSYVTYVFRKLFGYPEARAHELMMRVHTHGKAVVASGTKERCEYDVQRLHAHGLWASMQED